jgi:hypothetical protein
MEGRWFLSSARAITPFEGGIEELPNSNIDIENPGFPEKNTYLRSGFAHLWKFHEHRSSALNICIIYAELVTWQINKHPK